MKRAQATRHRLARLHRLLSIQRLQLQPTDCLVVSCPMLLSMEQRVAIRDTVLRKFPGYECLVLDAGLTLAAVGPAPQVDARP